MIYLFFGEDSFRIKEAVDKIAQDFEEKKIIDEQDLEEAVSISQQLFGQRDLFGKQPLIIFRNVLNSKNSFLLNKLFENLSSYSNDSTLKSKIVFWQDGKVDKRLKIVEWLLKNAEVEEFRPLRIPQVREWIIRRLDNREETKLSYPVIRLSLPGRQAGSHPIIQSSSHPKIESQAVEELIRLHGNNLWALKNEIEKLVAFAQGRLITKDDVELLCHSTIEENIFEFCDALGFRNKNEALVTFEKLLNQQQDTGFIFAMLVRQFRLLILAKEEKGLAGQHPFVQRKALVQTKYWKLEELKDIYQRLLEIDIGAKTGKRNLETELVLLIAQL